MPTLIFNWKARKINNCLKYFRGVVMSNKNLTGKSPYNSFAGPRPVAHNQQKKNQLQRTAQLQQWAKGVEGVELPKAVKINGK